MPRSTRSLRFLDTQISISETFKVGFDLTLEGFLKLLQNSSILHLKPSRLGPPGRKVELLFFFFSHLHICLKLKKNRPSFNLSVMKKKNPLTLTDIKN